jgi:hypothetical protein
VVVKSIYASIIPSYKYNLVLKSFSYGTQVMGHPVYTGCPKNGVLTVHYGVEETTVNVRKMFKKILLDLFADLAVFESGT